MYVILSVFLKILNTAHCQVAGIRKLEVENLFANIVLDGNKEGQLGLTQLGHHCGLLSGPSR